MTREQLKNAIISLVIGACVAFFSTLFTSLADLIKSHGTEIVSGAASAYYYIAKMPRV